MNDLDLLLRADTFEMLLRELPERDFVLRPLANPFERTLEDRRNGIVLDLHRAFTQPQRVAVDYGALWASARPLGDGAPALAPAHALAVHALLMANQQFATHLRKYLDLWLLARDASVAREAATCAARWRMRRGERRWLQFAVLPASPVPALPWRPSRSGARGNCWTTGRNAWAGPRASGGLGRSELLRAH